LSNIVGIVRYGQVSPGIAKAQKSILMIQFLNGDFPVLHCLGIGLSVLGIRSYCIGKYMSKKLANKKPSILSANNICSYDFSQVGIGSNGIFKWDLFLRHVYVAFVPMTFYERYLFLWHLLIWNLVLWYLFLWHFFSMF
jgi:hypothetical protein